MFELRVAGKAQRAVRPSSGFRSSRAPSRAIALAAACARLRLPGSASPGGGDLLTRAQSAADMPAWLA
jgi:hypothetical protein